LKILKLEVWMVVGALGGGRRSWVVGSKVVEVVAGVYGFEVGVRRLGGSRRMVGQVVMLVGDEEMSLQ
jgi:hypothetical protein